MAITTVDGKFALMCYNQPFQVVLTQPASPFDQGEKQGLMWQFPEILWEPPSVEGIGQGIITAGTVGPLPVLEFGQGVIAGAATLVGASRARQFTQGTIEGQGVVLGQGFRPAFAQGIIAGTAVVVGEGAARVFATGGI